MKKIKGLFLLITVLAMVFSCSKFDQTELNMSGFSGTIPEGQVVIQETIFVVEPNGIDETEALSEAFTNAINSGHGSVVQLVEGEYHINFIEIREFFGSFRGSGNGKTIITPVTDLAIDDLLSQNLNAGLIRFVGGEIKVSNMTLRTPPGPLSTGNVTRIKTLFELNARTYLYTSENEYINVMFDNINFFGNWENVNEGIHAGYGIIDSKQDVTWPLSNMDITITNCYFEGFSYYGALIDSFKRGKITVGTKGNGNIFINNGSLGNSSGASLGLWCNVNVDIIVEGNKFFVPANTRYGIELFSSPIPAYLEQVDQTRATISRIEQNEFNIEDGFGGLLVNDRRRYFYPYDIPMIVQVKNNIFNMNDNVTCGITCNNMFGMIINNNRFEGSGKYGVRILGSSPYPYNENGIMLGNNFCNANLSLASVLLDIRTKNWTIIGGNLGETIIDNTLGTGNHIITGLYENTSDVSLGQTIVDNLEMMRDALHVKDEGQ